MPLPFDADTLRGTARLAVDATCGVSRVAEGLHQAVWRTLGAPGPAGRARGLTGAVYASVRGTTRLVGVGVDRALALLPEAPPAPTPGRAAWRAALNGVLGDHLAATGNPLATPMTLHVGGQTLDEPRTLSPPDASGRVAVFVHGLCMDERAWTLRDADAPTHAEALAMLGYTPVAVRYNTGLPVAENGRLLAARLDRLVARWPRPVEEIAFVGHSMGGLVARSALHHAGRAGAGWRDATRSAVFLGTPHRGAPLEGVGGRVDAALALTPFTAPFAALGRVRSAGITDLRRGRVAEGPAPVLPGDVACYAVAATLSGRRSVLTDGLVGDGLVPLPSALDADADPIYRLGEGMDQRVTLSGLGHLALLWSPRVTEHLVRWLGAGAKAP